MNKMTTMMDIKQYINHFKEMYWQFTDDGFSTLLRDNPQIEIIVSTSVFPELVELNKKDFHLIWDMKYWDFFDKYMRYVAFFLRNDVDSKEDAVKHIQNNISKIIFEFLVCKMTKYPAISFCIARDILRGNPSYIKIEDDAICKRFSDSSKNGKRMQARWYVLLHETYHLEYKTKGKELFAKDIDTINQILNQICNHKIELPRLTPLSKKEKKECFNAMQAVLKGKNPSLIEELVCNYRAFIQLYDMQKEISDIDDDETVLHDLTETIRICLQFHSNLLLINGLWDKSVKALDDYYVNKKDPNQTSVRHRKEVAQTRMNMLIQHEIIYQVIIFHSISKYKKFSYVEMDSKNKIDKYLNPVIYSMTEWDLLLEIWGAATNLSSYTTFNPLQIIEARNMIMTWK